MSRIKLTGGVSIDEAELDLRASRSGGPGGQSVNTTASQIELRWDLSASSLPEWRLELVRERLGNRISKDDVLILQASEERSQHRNREAAVARFRSLVGEAVQRGTKRRSTKVPRSQKRKRLRDKRHRGRIKELREDPEPPK